MTTKTVRVPVAGAYNTRISAISTPPTASGYVGVGIVGVMVVGATTAASDKDARYINCFAQTVSDPLTGDRRIYLVKRPGFGTQATPASGEKGYALLVWTGSASGTDVISAFGQTNSTIYNGSSSLGAITGRATGITETFITTTPTLVVSSSDNTAWYYNTGAGSMTKISDADFPGNAGLTLAGTFAHIDGFACIMTTDGKVWASDLNSVTAWTATSFDTANAYPDMGVALVRNRNYVLAFGTESVQFFYNAGLTPFPLAKATAMTAKIGCVSADAIAQISDTTFWAGSTPQGGISIFQYDGGGINRVSTPEQDAILALAGASNITLTSIRFYGRSFVLCLAGATTLAYCVEEKMWHEWNSDTPLWYKCAGVSLGGTMVNYAVSNVSTSGKVYLMNLASLVFADDGTTYTARAQLPLMDFNSKKRKFVPTVELVADIEDSTSNVTLAYTDDDYNTYTTWGTLDLSTERPRATRCGSFRRRGWVLSHSANTPMRIEALEMEVELGNA